jgi:hypothetical protein
LEAAKYRTWTSSDGKYNVEAKFIKLAGGGFLTLEMKDGTTVDVKMESLSPGDRDFVRLRKWTQRARER